MPRHRSRPGGPARTARSAALAAAVVASLASLAAGPAPAREPRIRPESGPWPAGEGFRFADDAKKTRRSVSGIACPSGGTGDRTCLFVFDEGTQARFGVLGERSLESLPHEVVLVPGDGELDAEGAALDGETFYVTGSHSAKRGDCESNPGSRYVVRLGRDAVTGLSRRDAQGRLAGSATGALWELMAREPRLAPFVGEKICLGTEPPEKKPGLKGQRGANIEALAARGGRLFFGFRGPAVEARAPVLAVEASTLFDGRPGETRVTMLRVGERRGIRDMQAAAGGLLVLAGPDDDKASAGAGWVVGFWDGTTSADGEGAMRVLAELDLDGLVRASCDKEIKPEAMTVRRETDDHFEMVILSDGMCDGGPLLFRVPR